VAGHINFYVERADAKELLDFGKKGHKKKTVKVLGIEKNRVVKKNRHVSISMPKQEAVGKMIQKTTDAAGGPTKQVGAESS
jgi:hypothetical protein